MTADIVTANIESTFVVTTPDDRALALPFGDGFFEELDRRFDGFAGHSLISLFTFDSDWSTWERHPNGDEFVCLLSGRAEMHLRIGAEDRAVTLAAAGDYVIVPRGAWHTAKVAEPTTMLFVTPGEGTENREQPGD